MSDSEVRDLLERLRNEIKDAELDADTRKMMKRAQGGDRTACPRL